MPDYTNGLTQYALPATMASPPTVTVGAANAATAIASSVLVAASNAAFRFYGGTAGDDPLNVGYIMPAGVTPSDDSDPLIVDFSYTGTEFEFLVKTASAPATTQQYRMLVDGEEESGWRTGPAYAANAAYLIKITFAGSATRRIELEFHGMRFGGVRREAGGTVAVSAVDLGPTVIVIGDSWTRSAGAVRTLARTMGLLLHWYDVRPSGLVGTGWLAPGGSVKFRDRLIPDVIAHAPDILIVIGSINDSTRRYVGATLEREALALIEETKAALPDTLIVLAGVPWTGYWWWDQLVAPNVAPSHATILAQIENERDGLESAATRGGADLFIDMVPWITGSGTVGDPQGDGNADLYVAADGVHPTTTDGYDYFGAQLADALAEVWVTPTATLARVPATALPIAAILAQDGSENRDGVVTATTATGAIGATAGPRNDAAWLLGRGTTNYHPNPGNENVTVGQTDLGYAAYNGATVIRDTVNTTKAHSGLGSRRAITPGSVPGEGFVASTATGLAIAADATPFIGSLYFIGYDGDDHGGKVEAWLKLTYDDASTTVGTKTKDTLSSTSFQRIETTPVTATAAKTVDKIELFFATDADEAAAVLTFFGDDFQIEHRSSASAYAAGSLGTGYSWTGTANASTSVRASTILRYPADGAYDPDRGFAFVSFRRDDNDLDSSSQFILALGVYGTDDWIGMRVDNNETATFSISERQGTDAVIGGATLSSVIDSGVWYDAYVDWNGTTVRYALDGSDLRYAADREAPSGAAASLIDVGCLVGGSFFPGAVGPVILGTRPLRIAEIDALIARNRAPSLNMLGDVPVRLERV